MVTGGTPTLGNLFRKPPFHHVLVGKERLDSELNIWRQEFYERSESYDVLQWIRMQ